MAKSWKRLSRKTLTEHPRITLWEDIVELPNGLRTDYVLAAPALHDSVSVVALNSKGELLIQEEYNYPLDKVLWELPGGGMEGGETIEEAAVRELAEEAKYTAKMITILGQYYTQNRFKDAKQHVVLCEDMSPYLLPADKTESMRTRWVNRDQLNQLVDDGEIKNINMLASLMLYERYLAQKQAAA